MRKFNITGKIIPAQHYYVDLSPQIQKLMGLIDEGTYFVINRPRQFGKTTLLNFLARHLQESREFLPAILSFERFASKPDLPLEEFYRTFWNNVLRYRSAADTALAWSPVAPQDPSHFQDDVRSFCQAWPDKKIVLLVDEVDAIPETTVIDFLRALRSMFMDRDWAPTFHSVILTGVHDIKNLKARYRDESRALGSASPFNIAIDYLLPAFSQESILQYYGQHTAETGQVFDDDVIARVHQVTSGHPWLVSVLAKIMVEELVPERHVPITTSHFELACQHLLKTSNTNFDSLIRHAHEPELEPVVLDLLQGKEYPFTPYDAVLNRLSLYGVIRPGEDNRSEISNQLYAQVLFASFQRMMASRLMGGDARAGVEEPNGRLNFGRVLDKFQAFMKSKGADLVHQQGFREGTAQLLLLSYLDLLVNGKGWTFKEVRSGPGRIDVLCCYGRQKEVVELKLWYGERRFEQGLEQLAGYLESENLDHGYLVVFDRRENVTKEYNRAEEMTQGKNISIWVV